MIHSGKTARTNTAHRSKCLPCWLGIVHAQIAINSASSGELNNRSTRVDAVCVELRNLGRRGRS
jgi:hypothetical protein